MNNNHEELTQEKERVPRRITATLEIEVHPNNPNDKLKNRGPEYMPQVSVGRISLSSKGIVLDLDFQDSRTSYSIEDNVGHYSTLLTFPDLDYSRDSLISEGVLDVPRSDDELEELMFDIANSSDMIEALYMELWDEQENGLFDGRIIIREWILTDAYGGDEIDLLRRKFRENWNPDGVSVVLDAERSN